MRVRLLAGIAAMALGSALPGSPAHAQISLGSFSPSSGFSVDGRRGPYIGQIKPEEIDTRVVQEETQGLSLEGDNVATYERLQLRMPQVEAKLVEMINRVDSHWPHGREGPPRTMVLASGEYAPTTFPDGTIAVRMGMLINAQSDDEAAYILAHEFGHVRMGHFADDGNFRRKLQVATLISRIYVAAIAASEIEATRVGDDYRFNVDDERLVQEQRQEAAEANVMLRKLMTYLFERPWTRREEDQSDALAFDLATASGFAAQRAAPAVFGNLNADYELRQEAGRHAREVLDHLRRTAVSRENVNDTLAGQGANVLDRLRGTATRVGRDRLMEVAEGYLGQRHRTPEARLTGISTYAERAYPEGVPDPVLQTDWLDEVRSLNEFKQAKIVVEALQASAARDNERDLPGAIEALRPALSTALFGSAPIVTNTAAELHGRNGDVREAERLYAIAHAHPDQNLSAFVDHASLMADNRRFDRAIEVLAMAKAHMARVNPAVDVEKPFLPTLVMIAFRRQQKEEGLRYLERCMSFEDDDLRSMCTRSVFRNRPDTEEMDPETQARVDAAIRSAEAQSALGGDVDGLLRGVNGWLRGN